MVLGRHWRTVAAVTVLVVTAAVAACDGGAGGGGGRPVGGLVEVTYATAYGPFGREAYVYAAIEKGFFRERGIRVEVINGKGISDNMGLMAAGKVDFAANDLAGMIDLLGNQDGRKFVGVVRAVAAIQQRTLNSIMVLEGSPITSPGQLAGKSIGATLGATPHLIFPAYARLAGIAGPVRWVNVPPTGIVQALAAGRVDAIRSSRWRRRRCRR